MQYAIETTGLSKSFKGIHAVNNLKLKIPVGSIYGFIGENGSGKSTTEKLICGLLVPSGGEIKLFGKPYTDPEERSQLGVLIENPACFPYSTVYQNLFMQALNLGLPNPEEEVKRVLELVRMSGAASRRYKHCSLGMKQRIGVAQSLMGNPKMLILDEPINGLDADGMRIVRETLLQVNKEYGTTILISSHILGELEKIATHYGIIRNGTLIKEMVASEMSKECRSYVFVKTNNDSKAIALLKNKYKEVSEGDGGVRVFDATDSGAVSKFLFESGVTITEMYFKKIGLEEYYLSQMKKGDGK